MTDTDASGVLTWEHFEKCIKEMRAPKKPLCFFIWCAELPDDIKKELEKHLGPMTYIPEMGAYRLGDA